MGTSVPEQLLIAGLPERTGSWSLWALALARTVDAQLDEDEVLERTARQVAAVLAAERPAAIRGASPAGRRLARAVAAQMRLPTPDIGGPVTGCVALVDSVVNTGVQLGNASAKALLDGAAATIAVAVVAQADVVEAWRSKGQRLLALTLV